MIVKKLRDKSSWSQEQLAQMAGVSLRTIQRVEAGNKASLETLKSLASVFEVELSTLTEEIIVIDKDSAGWKNEPWFIKFGSIGIKKRSHLLMIEYSMLAIGVILWILHDPAAPLVFFLAYTNAKLLAYLDRKAYW